MQLTKICLCHQNSFLVLLVYICSPLDCQLTFNPDLCVSLKLNKVGEHWSANLIVLQWIERGKTSFSKYSLSPIYGNLVILQPKERETKCDRKECSGNTCQIICVVTQLCSSGARYNVKNPLNRLCRTKLVFKKDFGKIKFFFNCGQWANFSDC
jgi:hypothetical protein